jgi:hypothetical protein
MRLIIEGSSQNNQVIDGRGKVLSGNDCLLVKSARDTNGKWHSPENITLKNFVIDKGSVRLFGLGINGEGPFVRESSRNPNHTEYCRMVAPKNITFDNLRITAQARIPFYVAPGCSKITLQNSVLDGVSESTTIYLDCESAENKIINNQLNTICAREVIAVDGSARNVIEENVFNHLRRGGVFLYRNSGEGGTIRHQPPIQNKIINNKFNYDDTWLAWFESLIWPAVWVGSRSHFIRHFVRFRNDDKGFTFGSSINNNDLARDNIISGNLPKNIRVRVWETK